jgi:hypothetical protein
LLTGWECSEAMAGRTHCRFHPERDALLWCEKYEYGYCGPCLEQSICTDPDLYCKSRDRCRIWYASREGRSNRQRQEGDAPE